MAGFDIQTLLAEAERLNAVAEANANKATRETRVSPYASRIPSATPSVGEIREAQELLLGGQATAPSPVSYALGAIPTALRVNQNPGNRLDILREFANNPRSSTYQRVASEAGAGPRTAAVAGTAAEFLEPGPDIGPLVNAVPFVPGLLRKIAGTGRRGERAALRIARTAELGGGGPVRGGTAPVSSYWTTYAPAQGQYAWMGAFDSNTARTVEGELLLDPRRILDVTDEVLFENVEPGSAPEKFLQWVRSLPDNPAVARGNRSNRLRELISDWDAGARDTQDFFREVRNELGRTQFDTALRSIGLDAVLQGTEEGLESLQNAAEVIVLNPRAVRSRNVNTAEEASEALGILGRSERATWLNDQDISALMNLYDRTPK